MESAQGMPSHLKRPMKLVTSLVIWYGTFTVGVSISFLGAGLLEFSKKFETNVTTVSKVFSILPIAFLTGALLSGIIYRYLSRSVLSGVFLILMGIGIASYPLAPSLPVFFGIAVVAGFSAGGYDTAQIVWIIELWSGEAAPYIQVQHFSYALGTFVSPMIIRPYLAEEKVIMAGVTNSTTDEILEPVKSQLWIPFLIGGSCSIFGGVALLILTCLKNRGSTISGNQEDAQPPDPKTGQRFSHKIKLIVLSSIILGAYCGMEVYTIQFIPTFMHFIPLKLAPSDGARILTGLTAAFMIGRGLGVFLVLRIRPEFIIVGNFVVILTGNVVLNVIGGTSYEMLWGGAVLLGVGFSVVFPSFYGFLEKHLHVTNVVGAVITSSSGLIFGLYPAIIGTWIEQNPYILMYTNYGSLIICSIAFGAMNWIVSGVREGNKGVNGYVGGKEELSGGGGIELENKGN
ncbi:Sodium-dependent glucose transporter 1 [Folsomia candida]|uniref:Sodium-dependent glucose transporter 1 n=1 Tax=Folsomia candida TaxID=158441 RepID=A0A226EWB6_FOLCA|nr:Sodium-dependent glucose transporter 1 [Folsomia candida]